MRSGSRLAVMVLVLLAVLGGLVLLAFASSSCAMDQPGRPCPEAGLNRAVLVSGVAITAGLAVTPFAFLGEFALRRRIEYRGSWGRALRRGLLAALVVAAFAGLRVGEALNVAAALFVLLMAALVEWFAVRRFDLP